MIEKAGVGLKGLEALSWTGVAALVLYGLAKGSEILIPLVVSVMIWYLLNALARILKKAAPFSRQLPELVWVGFSLLTVTLVMFGVFGLLAQSLSGIGADAQRYQENINVHLKNLASVAGMEAAPGIEQLIRKVDLKWAVGSVASIAALIAGDMGLILVYVLFLILEQESFAKKMRALVPDPGRRAEMSRLFARIQDGIREYVWMKTLMCVLVGILTYATLKVIGVEYAFFWAFVAFLANYIPTVGSVVGVALPGLFALVQFPTAAQCILTILLLFAVHFLVGNILEPKLMGGKLNISAFVVILSLVVWGKLWGITGMFLCVPLTVIAMIILSHFPATRPLAVLLSEDGEVRKGEADQ